MGSRCNPATLWSDEMTAATSQWTWYVWEFSHCHLPPNKTINELLTEIANILNLDLNISSGHFFTALHFCWLLWVKWCKNNRWTFLRILKPDHQFRKFNWNTSMSQCHSFIPSNNRCLIIIVSLFFCLFSNVSHFYLMLPFIFMVSIGQL